MADIPRKIEVAMTQDDVGLLNELQQSLNQSTQLPTLLRQAIVHNAQACLTYLLAKPEVLKHEDPIEHSNAESLLTVACRSNPAMVPMLMECEVSRLVTSHMHHSELRLLTEHFFTENSSSPKYDYLKIASLLVKTGAQVSGNLSQIVPLVGVFRYGIEQHMKNMLHFPQKYPLDIDTSDGKIPILKLFLKGNDVRECFRYVSSLSLPGEVASTLNLLIKTQCRFSGLCEYAEYASVASQASLMQDAMMPMMRYLHSLACILLNSLRQVESYQSKVAVDRSPPSVILEHLHSTHFSNRCHRQWTSLKGVHTGALREILHTFSQVLEYPCFQTEADKTNLLGLLVQDAELYAPFLNVYIYNQASNRAVVTLRELLVLCRSLRVVGDGFAHGRLEDVEHYFFEKLEGYTSLMNLTRKIIVSSIRSDRYLDDIQQLPLPASLIGYLMS